MLHDIPRCEKKLIALKAELEDCAFEYVSGRQWIVLIHEDILFFTTAKEAFAGADVVFFLAVFRLLEIIDEVSLARTLLSIKTLEVILMRLRTRIASVLW